ncbi:hypothetical protein Xbed_03488 [Xenorhabdus beddingii]|uniref:Uncharacterized protein n=1 Tax=Xenorhabdus beddingii TaxID=40578 RepID=A0A1Y2SFJ9_9GAMM|nr:hypothetical protein Xbed_03488 [Xenorhabdus beddingii]
MHQDTDGAAISNNVMLSQQQQVSVIRQLQQLTPDQRALAEVERCLRIEGGKFSKMLSLCLRGQRAQVMAGQSKTGVSRVNMLAGLAFGQHKTGAQALMTGNQTIKRTGQRLTVELTAQAQRDGNMVGQTGCRIELSQEP